MGWEGRQLKSAGKNGTNLSFTYDSEGIRTSKTVGSTTTKYLLNGTQILAQTTNGKTLCFFYDQQGNRVGMADSSNHFYYYIYNVQGDVIALADASTGKLAVTYTYDAWGKLVKLEDSTANSVGTQNPFRYRGYYYDTETGLYYLQSRYYDPDTGRFVNADTQLNEGVLGYNMFAYCENNPVMREDSTGEIFKQIIKGAIVGGTVSAICTLVHGGTTKEALIAFRDGAIEGALSEVKKPFKKVVAAVETVRTVARCRKAGASWGASLFAGATTLYSSMFYTSEKVSNYVLGFGMSLMSSGIESQIKKNANRRHKSLVKITYNNSGNQKKQYRFAGGPR